MTSAAALGRLGDGGSVSGDGGGSADVGSGVCATSRRRRWRQHASATLAEAWRRHVDGGSVIGGGGSVKPKKCFNSKIIL